MSAKLGERLNFLQISPLLTYNLRLEGAEISVAL